MSFLDFNPQMIPLKKNTKIPAVAFKGKNFNRADILKWTQQGGNVALLCRGTFFFIDIDSASGHADNGLASFVKWCQKHKLNYNQLFDQTLVQKTPTGGLHLIYRRPKDFAVGQELGFLPGVDLKGADNNYIVIAPTKIDGKAYAFVDPNKDPIYLPPDLARAIEKDARAKTRAREHVKPGEVVDGLRWHETANHYTKLDVFYTIDHGFGQPGVRNDNVFRWSQAMRNATDYETALAYAKIANSHTTPPLPLSEVQRTLRSAYEWGWRLKDNDLLEINGVHWVKVANRQDPMDSLAVLRSRFDQVKSTDAEDYSPADLYRWGGMSQFSNDERTVYNYGK